MTPLPQSLLEAVASAAVREGIADAVFTRLSTPIGRLLVVQGPNGIVRVGFEEEPEDALLAGVAAALGPRVIASDRELASTRDTISAYLEGDDDTLELPVDLGLVHAPFRREVLETLHDTVRRGDQREVDRHADRALAGEVRLERVARAGQLAVGPDDPGPEPAGHLGQHVVLGLLLEPDADHAGRALHDEQAPDRRAQAGEDGVGEALAHRGGGDGLEQGVGERGHAAALSRRVRTAVDTRCRAATVEMPSRAAMPS